jgi:hypothetical protein
VDIYHVYHIAKKLNRKFIFPKPFILFGHNVIISLEDEITDYYDIPTYKNPPFYFEKNGRVIPTNEKLSIKYYHGRTSLWSIDKTVDIIVLSLFGGGEFLPSRYGRIKCLFPINLHLKNIANQIITKIGHPFIFIHLRRGDVVEQYKEYTNPIYICNFFKEHKIKGNCIFVATNEKNEAFHDEIKSMFNLLGMVVYFEKDVMPTIDICNNTKIFMILNEIANESKINIVTEHLRLGSRIDYKLK